MPILKPSLTHAAINHENAPTLLISTPSSATNARPHSSLCKVRSEMLGQQPTTRRCAESYGGRVHAAPRRTAWHYQTCPTYLSYAVCAPVMSLTTAAFWGTMSLFVTVSPECFGECDDVDRACQQTSIGRLNFRVSTKHNNFQHSISLLEIYVYSLQIYSFVIIWIDNLLGSELILYCDRMKWYFYCRPTKSRSFESIRCFGRANANLF